MLRLRSSRQRWPRRSVQVSKWCSIDRSRQRRRDPDRRRGYPGKEGRSASGRKRRCSASPRPPPNPTHSKAASRPSPRQRVVARGHHEVRPVGAALRAAKPQLGQRHVAAASEHDRPQVGVGLVRQSKETRGEPNARATGSTAARVGSTDGPACCYAALA